MLVATYNIQWGKGRDGRVDLDRIARVIGNADVIGLQEVERNWRAMEYSDQVARLSQLFSDRYVHFAASVDIDASTISADGRVSNRRRQYGLLILSRWPILSARAFPLPKYPIDGTLNDSSIVLETVIAHPTAAFRLYNTHLNYLSEDQRLIQSRQIMDIIGDAPRQGGAIVATGIGESEFNADWMTLRQDELPPMPAPAILLGDFNMRPSSPEYALFAGPTDPGRGLLPKKVTFADALTLAGIKEDEGVTYPPNATEQAKRIDHIFLTAEFAGLVRGAWIDDEADASDHQPVFADIAWDRQQAPVANS